MRPPSKKIVVVIARDGAEGAALAQLVADTSTAWACTWVQMPADAAVTQTLGSAAAIVLATDGGAAADALPAGVPVIACGAAPPTGVGCVSWLRRPSAPALRTILHDALGPESATPIPPAAALPSLSSSPPSSTVWRRKTDMIVGRSAAIRALLDALDRYAPSTAAVSITGESGTGKELVARALHYSSERARAPFIALNCAAIPEPLFEAELFGYVRGAFTGAVSPRVGAFEGAHGGTLFLDEVGEMPKSMQPKLLRVLERGEVTRLGSNDSRQVVVRVVTATNRQLEDEVREGNFREDLYYRLRVCHVHVPPLRDRLEDIAPLVAHHLAIIANRERRSAIPRLSAAALETLLAHRWPGNVRELVNVLESAILLASSNVIDADHLQLQSVSAKPDDDGPILAYREAKSRFDAEYYTRLLRAAAGNVSLAAKLAQKTRKEIYDALRRAGLDADAYRDDAPHG